MKTNTVISDVRRGLIIITDESGDQLIVLTGRNRDPFDFANIILFCCKRFKEGARGPMSWHPVCMELGVLIGEKLPQRAVHIIMQQMLPEHPDFMGGMVVIETYVDLFPVTVVANFTPLGVFLSGAN